MINVYLKLKIGLSFSFQIKFINFSGENLVSKSSLQDEAQANPAPAGHFDGVDVARCGQESGRQGGDEGRPGALQKRAAIPSAAAAVSGGRGRLLLLLPEPPPLPAQRTLGHGVQWRRLAAAARLLQVHQSAGHQLVLDSKSNK
jgi:hypothetical protein